MAEPWLLEEEEEGEGQRLRRLLQVTHEPEKPQPPPGPSRSVTPQPGLCVKTRDGGGAKVFINVCHSGAVPPPPQIDPPSLQRLLLQDPPPSPPSLPSPSPSPSPSSFRIPMSLGEPHAELDRGGQGCTAYDVVVNSGFFRTLQTDPLYLELFLTVALEGLSEKYGVELELTGWRLLKNRKFMGSISAQRIRGRPQPRIQELESPPEELPPAPASPPEPPEFVVVAEPSAQHPRVLQLRVLLPQTVGAGALWLGLNEERLVLTGGGGLWGDPPLLELWLPLPPDPARCHAQFRRRTKVLTVTMPLKV